MNVTLSIIVSLWVFLVNYQTQLWFVELTNLQLVSEVLGRLGSVEDYALNLMVWLNPGYSEPNQSFWMSPIGHNFEP